MGRNIHTWTRNEMRKGSEKGTLFGPPPTRNPRYLPSNHKKTSKTNCYTEMYFGGLARFPSICMGKSSQTSKVNFDVTIRFFFFNVFSCAFSACHFYRESLGETQYFHFFHTFPFSHFCSESPNENKKKTDSGKLKKNTEIQLSWNWLATSLIIYFPSVPSMVGLLRGAPASVV